MMTYDEVITTPEVRPEAVVVTEAELTAAALAVHRQKYDGLVSWDADSGKRAVAWATARAALEAAAQVRSAQDHSGEANEMIGEVERLRGALITTGRNVGAVLDGGVSTDFLMHVPEEVRLKVERLKEGDRNVNIALNRQARRIAELQEQTHMALAVRSMARHRTRLQRLRHPRSMAAFRRCDDPDHHADAS
jgi:hypothetical protein